jgi:hypothetical protein
MVSQLSGEYTVWIATTINLEVCSFKKKKNQKYISRENIRINITTTINLQLQVDYLLSGENEIIWDGLWLMFACKQEIIGNKCDLQLYMFYYFTVV